MLPKSGKNISSLLLLTLDNDLGANGGRLKHVNDLFLISIDELFSSYSY